MNQKRVLIITYMVLLLIVGLSSFEYFFPKLNLSVSPKESTLTLNDKRYSHPLNKRLLRGTYKYSVTSPGYLRNEGTIELTKDKKMEIVLDTKKSKFIKTLPLYEEKWDMYYNEEDFFYIILKDETGRQDALNFLKNKGIDIVKEKIEFDYMAGVGGHTGP